MKKAKTFYPVHYYRAWMIVVLLLGVLITLGVYFPHSLTQEADPFTMPTGKLLPPWYFVPVFKMLELLPEHFAETVGLLLLMVFLLWPLLDKGPGRHFTRRKFFAFLGLVVLIGYVGLLLWAWLE